MALVSELLEFLRGKSETLKELVKSERVRAKTKVMISSEKARIIIYHVQFPEEGEAVITFSPSFLVFICLVIHMIQKGYCWLCFSKSKK